MDILSVILIGNFLVIMIECLLAVSERRRIRVWFTPLHTRDINNGINCCYVWHMTLIVRVGEMPGTGATYYYTQLGLQDKGPAIEGLVICCMLSNQISYSERGFSR